ncbi:MAG: hypothetical protein DMG06_04650 [Acidobacteria bacterium]|nr:MAG: hypothetical protein DMG06_04650 [Acidobacteriota bacterium]
MKNPLDRLTQSNLKFWKKSAPQQSEEETSPDSKELSLPRHASFPTKILKDFIDNVVRKENPVVLDIGPVIGSNIEYFLNFGIKIYMEDFLAAYNKPKYTVFLDDKLTLDEKKFFSENFSYGDNYFDGLICWDILSYLETKFARTFVEKISAKMKPTSFVLGFFQTLKGKGPAPVHKYRVLDEFNLEHIPVELKMETRKIYQSREINQLFPGYQSQKFYLLKHNILEVLLKKV